MAAVEQETMAATEANSAIPRKRKPNNKKSNKKPNKKLKPVAKSKNPTPRMKKLYKKRAKAYNSDEEEEEEEEEVEAKEQSGEEDSSDEENKCLDLDEDDDDEYGEKADTGITKFLEGCNAFKVAFLKIMKKHIPNDSLGPILSAHKKLVAEKLLEEENEHKAKKKAKKDKQLEKEKAHVKPDSFLNAKEKELIQIATRGVVKFFNEVNKVQYSQRGLSKDAKEVKKRKNQPLPVNAEAPISNFFKVIESDDKESEHEPGWAPLRDSYMLANPRLKDWNEIPDSEIGGNEEPVHMESSSDDD